MSPPPARPKVFHITHVDNLDEIVAAGGLLSDAAMIARGGPQAAIGMTQIKRRRLGLPVSCHPGDHVGEYVPFYFCPRSIMLFVIHCANHPDLNYRGGQGPVVHLQSDLHDVVSWASQNAKRWAFSKANAGARYAQCFADLNDLDQIDWNAVNNSQFQDPLVKEAKQAEFLLHESFPWGLVEAVGVHSQAIRSRAVASITSSSHRPPVDVRPGWYY